MFLKLAKENANEVSICWYELVQVCVVEVGSFIH